MESFGFIHDKLDIKILILFILGRLEVGVSMETLTQLTLCDDGIGYFDFFECVQELEDSKHIVQENHLYFITPKGVKNGTITENSLPYSVRKLAEENTAKFCKQTRRNAMIHTEILEKEGGGYTVSCTLNDGLGEILNFSIFTATKEQADEITTGFGANAEEVYGEMIKLLTGEKS